MHLCNIFGFTGPGQRTQKVINMEGAQILIDFLKCDKSRSHKKAARSIIRRYMAGDQTLKRDIDINRASDAPINQMARESVALDKKRLRDPEEEDTLEIQERKLRMRLMLVECNHKQALTTQMSQASYLQTCPTGVMDEWARLMFQDSILNVIMLSNSTSTQPRITNDVDNTPLTMSVLATELGMRMDLSQLQRAGIEMAKLYRKRYPDITVIPKHIQKCDGAVRPVNSYTRKDADIMEEAIRKFAK